MQPASAWSQREAASAAYIKMQKQLVQYTSHKRQNAKYRWKWRAGELGNKEFSMYHSLQCIKCNVCFHFHLERLVTFPKLLSPEDIRLSQTAIYWTGQPHLFHSSPSWEAVILSQYPWHDLPPSLFPTKNRAKATCIQNSWLKHPAA